MAELDEKTYCKIFNDINDWTWQGDWENIKILERIHILLKTANCLSSDDNNIWIEPLENLQVIKKSGNEYISGKNNSDFF